MNEHNLKASIKVFRIYRDARFSKDKTPYKLNFGGHVVPNNGREVHLPGYYLHIERGRSFVGAGIWRPERMDLNRIRDYIHNHPDELRQIISQPAFKNMFGGMDQGDRLKTIPRGFDSDDPAAEFIRLKSFTAGVKIPDRAFTTGDVVRIALDHFQVLAPLVDWLRRAMKYQR